jgi:MFS transporter, DHA1 family, multidrug resistance protein
MKTEPKTQEPMQPITLKQWAIAILAILTAVCALMGTDLYIPAMPDMAKSLHVMPSDIQMTITVYLLGIGFGALFYGPLSDKIGRKPAMLSGMLTGLIGCLLIIYARNINLIIIGRLIQGLGASAGICIATSIIMDTISDKKQIAFISSYLALFMGLSPLLAPPIGGYLTHLFNWRACFIALAIYFVILTLIYIFFFNETNTNKNKHALKPKVILSNYFTLIKNRKFIIMCICAGIPLAWVISYANIAPFLFINKFHISTVAFGWITLIIGVGNLIGKYSNALVIKRLSLIKTIQIGMLLGLIGGVWLLFFKLIGIANIYTVIIGVIIAQLAVGLVISNTPAIALPPFRHIGGSASALYRSSQQFMAFIISAILTALPWHNTWVLGASFCILAIIGVILLIFNKQAQS